MITLTNDLVFMDRAVNAGAGAQLGADQRMEMNADSPAIRAGTADAGVFSRKSSGQFADNNRVRQQLVDALLVQFGSKSVIELPKGVRDALKVGSRDDLQLDAEGKVTSGRPLTARRIRAVLTAVKSEIQIRNALDQQITATFNAQHGVDCSPRNLELVRDILMRELATQMAAHPGVTLAELTGPDSLYTHLLACCRRISGGNNSMLLSALALPANQVKPFLKACAALIPGGLGHGFEGRLFALADKLEKLSDFSPVKVFKIAYPELPWPREIPRDLAALDADQHALLCRQLDNLLTADLHARMGVPGISFEEQRKIIARINVSAFLKESGVSISVAREVLAGRRAFTPDLLPKCAFVMGVQKAERGLDAAFDQTVADLTRAPCTVSIPQTNGAQPWTMPRAATVAGHPFAEEAQRQLRTRIEAFCGPQASASMKANIFLFMSQSAHSIDGIYNGLMQTGRSCSTRGYHYEFAHDADGSVVVSRTVKGPHVFAIDMSIRFHLDGSQELAEPVRTTIDKTVTTPQMDAYEAGLRDEAAQSATREMNKFLDTAFYQAFADQFDPEVDELRRQYPSVDDPGKVRTLKMRASNILKIAVDNDPALRDRFLSAPPVERQTMLQDLKTRHQAAAKRNMLGFALLEQALADAERTLREAAGEVANGVDVNLDNLSSKLRTINSDEGTEEELAARFQTRRDRFLAERRAVLDGIREQADLDETLRKTLLVEVLVRPHADREGVQIALDLARSIPVPPAAWRHDANSVKAACFSIARAIQARFATLDLVRFPGEQRGHIATLALITLLGIHRAEMQALIAAGNDEVYEGLLNDPAVRNDASLELFARIVTGVLGEERVRAQA